MSDRPFSTRVHRTSFIDIDRNMYECEGARNPADVPEEGSVVHPLWHEMTPRHELLPEGVEGVLLAGREVTDSTWQRFVVGVGDALGEGADAGGF